MALSTHVYVWVSRRPPVLVARAHSICIRTVFLAGAGGSSAIERQGRLARQSITRKGPGGAEMMAPFLAMVAFPSAFPEAVEAMCAPRGLGAIPPSAVALPSPRGTSARSTLTALALGMTLSGEAGEAGEAGVAGGADAVREACAAAAVTRPTEAAGEV